MGTDDPGDDPEAAEALRRIRPAVDLGRRERTRARVRARIADVNAPASVGRYQLLDPIGSGGMGIVHAAYDPQIDRKVALKLLRAGVQTEPDRERLLREARALGRLRHPNVVTVHGVELIGDQLVVVMELVEGLTLAEWARTAPRAVAEIADVYAQAARGLAAAHALGIVHRDFKPTNAVLGDDRCVRVLDFGLAQLATGEPQPGASTATDGSVDLTTSDALAGTIPYMAPEVLDGGTATAASDQWSFCVSLHEALQGVRPFTGSSAAELRASIAAGRFAVPAGRPPMPAWLRSLIERGLEQDPSRRLPSMARVADELTRARGWRRWRWPALAGMSAATALAAVAWASGDGGAAAEPCSAPRLDEAWGPAQAAALEQRFAGIGSAYAAEAGARVTAALERRVAELEDASVEGCRAYRRGELSDALRDRQLACLRRRTAELRHAVSVTARVEASTVGASVDVVAGMAPLAWCADPDMLSGDVEPPADPATRAAVALLQDRLARVEALERGARTSEALEAARAIFADARALDHVPTVTEALLVEGRILILIQRYADAIAPLRQAEAEALSHGRSAEAVIAGARRVLAEAQLERDLPGIAREATLLESLSGSVAAHPLARPLLLNNLGVMQLIAMDRDGARRYFEDARAARELIAAPDPELAVIDSNLALVTTEPRERARRSEEVWRRSIERLGPSHTITLQAQLLFGHALPDPAEALPVLRSVADAYRINHPEAVPMQLGLAATVAFFADEIGAHDDAVAAFATIVELTSSSAAPDLAVKRDVAAGWLELLTARGGRGAEPFARALAATEGKDDWSSRVERASALLGDGRRALHAGDRRRARLRLASAVELYADIARLGTSHEFALRLAAARWDLARALGAGRADAEWRGRLERDVRETWAATGSSVYRDRLASRR